MELLLDEKWKAALKAEIEKPYFTALLEFISDEYKNKTIYPVKENIFAALNKCSLKRTKIVILGQDPYHGEGQAHGLSFSVPDGISFPPSLRNIFKEIVRDFETPLPLTGNLERWAEQGVLLLNATLTVRAGEAGSHQKKGWETFTNELIRTLSDQKEHLVFILWGSYAQKKSELIDLNKHLVLQGPHPSPLSAYRGFLGCGHFRQANNYLISHDMKPIVW